jgi:hypothetical protein
MKQKLNREAQREEIRGRRADSQRLIFSVYLLITL